MKNFTKIIILFSFLFFYLHAHSKEYKINSPNGKISLNVCADNDIIWSAYISDKVILKKCPLSLSLSNGETLGAMDNAQPANFFPRFERPMSQGTRCHQIAMYVIYESPLQMLSDSPSNYYKEKECTGFISEIPTTWDDTKVLAAKMGEYIAMARKNGDSWYIGAMNNEEQREMELDFSFLPEGKFNARIVQDGINADRHAEDYRMVSAMVDNNTKLNIKLYPGGGWAAIITK